ARLRERRVLGEEAVARVDGLGPALLRGLEHAVDAEVALRGGSGAHEEGLVGLSDVEGQAVRLRVDGHRLDSELATGPDDAHRDLPAVGDEDLAEIAAHCWPLPRGG